MLERYALNGCSEFHDWVCVEYFGFYYKLGVLYRIGYM